MTRVMSVENVGLRKNLVKAVCILDGDERTACPVLRIITPVRKFRSRFKRLACFKIGDNIDVILNHVEPPDILIVQRNAAVYWKILRQLRNYGTKLIYEIDDLLINVPEFHPDYATYTLLKPFIVAAIKDADAVTVSTDRLKHELSIYNHNIYVLPNYIDVDLWQVRHNLSKKKKDVCVIGFGGTPTHEADIQVIIPAIKRLIRKYGNKILFHFVGCIPEDLRTWPQVEYYTFVRNYYGYVRWLKRASWDIAVVPLRTCKFNMCKSNIKFLEYSVCRVPSIYSRIDPYANSIVEFETGILCEESYEVWYDAIDELINNVSLREKISKNAYEYVMDKYLLEKHVKKWEEVYFDVI
ncbi:glycosyltransferase [Thermodesulforhabdus norvegica]|uniref:Glycosyltransferase involved in cell wall bisynthesis n=1 Tax=Thermodesulforhabdus norvegica TaxID=39841 RepID=A0A1I4TE10_9BACT|nr:glycosyltransferase [Thermodesulforhabdus norvegica]SFM74906.1 Glycosyltransferase involved in cell wall bisynthesis [Thermodesulforhabdus norvegica]